MDKKVDTYIAAFDEPMRTRLNEMRMLIRRAAPVKRALAIAEITSLEVLASYSEEEILALHGIGPRDLPVLRTALQTVGLVFRREQQA